MQTATNANFMMSWLPSFALDPPTEKEVKVSPLAFSFSLAYYQPFFAFLNKEVLAEVAVDYRLVADETVTQGVEEGQY